MQHFDLDSNQLSYDRSVDLEDHPAFNHLLADSSPTPLEVSLDTHPVESEITYLVEYDLRSWLSIQVWCREAFLGVLSIAWKSSQEVSNEDKALLVAVANLVSQCYDIQLRLQDKPKMGNEERDLQAPPKAEKLQQKLTDYAFFTSHNIRHPLTTILALIDLIKINWDHKEQYEESLQQLKIEIMNLDEIIRVMTAKIELD